MQRLDQILFGGTAGTGIGGAILAQATQSPTVTYGSLALAGMGLASLWLREHYQARRIRLETERLRASTERLRAEIELGDKAASNEP